MDWFWSILGTSVFRLLCKMQSFWNSWKLKCWTCFFQYGNILLGTTLVSCSGKKIIWQTVALKISHYQLPTLEDILPELSRAKSVHSLWYKRWVVAYWARWAFKLSNNLRNILCRCHWAIHPAPRCSSVNWIRCYWGFSGIRVVADGILIVGDRDSEEETLQNDGAKLGQLQKV